MEAIGIQKNHSTDYQRIMSNLRICSRLLCWNIRIHISKEMSYVDRILLLSFLY